MDFDWAWRQAEDFLRRHIKSKAVREAEKRRLERQSREAMRRLKRAGTLAGVSGVGIVGYGLAVAPIAPVGLAALAAGTVVLAAGSLFWQSGRSARPDGVAADLDLLVPLAEDWLLRRRTDLPSRAGPALDSILIRLADLAPHLATLDPTGPLAGEARRLIGGHLPRLVESWLAVPITARDADPDTVRRLIEGLVIVADELGRLCREIGQGPLFTFEAQRRFIETRYRSAEGLKGE